MKKMLQLQKIDMLVLNQNQLAIFLKNAHQCPGHQIIFLLEQYHSQSNRSNHFLKEQILPTSHDKTWNQCF